jgi:hypothetical protein
MTRPLTDRVLDRLWREAGNRLALDAAPTVNVRDAGASVSGDMPWVMACSGLADGTRDSRRFRRLRAVRNVVETVGPTDARFYAKRILQWGAEWLGNPLVADIDDWGDPIRCPRLLLGTGRPFSPTTLRYLATALWLKRSHKLPAGADIVEIGVGFGGLAAMNALVSKSRTHLVDLPQVEQAALRMLAETGLGAHGMTGGAAMEKPVPMVISNYAFTEMNAGLQRDYFEKFIRGSSHGIIISNAGIFAPRIDGLSDVELLNWFRSEGLPAQLDQSNDLSCPSDHRGHVSMIHW